MEGATCGGGSGGGGGSLCLTRTSKEATAAIWGWSRAAGINALRPHCLPVRREAPPVYLCPADGTGEWGPRPGLGGQAGRTVDMQEASRWDCHLHPLSPLRGP